ncbi:Lrp/AsnC family transcriptional regulator, leucine-responsive regulatory protein [Sphingopyxis macrogoltabida]|nr:Lrp/AsnC family transcriptional regulator, leucine-responsive regulatory protein [Sphingopyxis macrogoltabida]
MPLVKLARQYCAETLAAEVAALPAAAWLPHPGRLPGNDAVPLITPAGQVSNGFSGPMAPTEALRQCPYITEILADLGAVWGRSRLMGLAPGAVVPEHVDVGYYWRTHIRIHIPVVTNPGVAFSCDRETVHMAPGECWLFDSFCLHNVRNDGDQKRVHLVLDTVGGEKLWGLIAEAKTMGRDAQPVQRIAPGSVAPVPLAYEQVNLPAVMSVWEVRCHIDFLLAQCADTEARGAIAARLEQFANAWGALWAQYGTAAAGLPAYRRLIGDVQRDLQRLEAQRMLLPNNVPFDRALAELVFMVAAPDAASPVAAAA